MENINDRHKYFTSSKSLDFNQSSEILEERESMSSKDFRNNVLAIDLVKVTQMSEIVQKDIKKNEDVMIIQACYQVPHHEKVFTWDIYKTFPSVKEFLNMLKNDTREIKEKLAEYNLHTRLEFLTTMKLDELKSNAHVISFVGFMNDLLRFESLRKNLNILEFLEISKHSFHSYNAGTKPKEGYILKQAEPNICRKLISCLCCCCLTCCCKNFNFNKRWFVLKEDMICYLDNSNTTIGKDIFWFDQEIQVDRDYNKTPNTICLTSISRRLILKFSDEFEREIWFEIISRKIMQYKYTLKNIYNSFANEKDQCNAKWFVDANSYFTDLYIKLMSAKQTIFIAGWWISPELFLQRPVSLDEFNSKEPKRKMSAPFKCNRLVDVLRHKAENGVKIYILVFKETKIALTLNSSHTKEAFNHLHENIKVTRHPKKNFDLLWSHHEKLVIIDQKCGYIGGLDLCWGRYDTSEHRMVEEENSEALYQWPGIDYSNPRIKDFLNVQSYQTEQISRETQHRMPWHDVHILIEGPAVSDLTRHFVERWNFARTIDKNRKYAITQVKRTVNGKSKGSKDSDTNQSFLTESDSGMKNPLIENENRTDDGETLKAKKRSLRTDNIDRSDFMREKDPIIRRVSDDTISQGRNTKLKFRNSLLDTIKGAFWNKKPRKWKWKWYHKIFSRRDSERTNNESLLNMNINHQKLIPNERKMKCQVLRSASQWSVGLDTKEERSILQAYYDLIEHSKHYIYIENQFFISKTYTDEEYIESAQQTSSFIENEIALKIRLRIEEAYKKKEKFRVFVFIPLLPGFPGEVNESATLQLVLKYTYKTISRNKGLSLLEKLYQLMNDKYEDYIYFFSLRTHSLLHGVPRTELIYIHSKLMIVDDEICLIGSANINDRSMLGSRDSEIAVIVKETETIPSIMDGQPYQASDFVRSLRIRLLKEHFGYLQENNLPSDLFIDPLDDTFFDNMKSIAKMNTCIYREIFNCYPDDNFTKFESIQLHQMYTTDEEEQLKKRYEEKIHSIIGNLVEFPLYFLKEEHLKSYFCLEILVPLRNFV